MVVIYAGSDIIETTDEHPFYVEGKGWIKAGNLKIGDTLRLLNGNNIKIDGVEVQKLDKEIKVYNFEVEDFHTYFVGETGILVHNTCFKTTIKTTSSLNSRILSKNLAREGIIINNNEAAAHIVASTGSKGHWIYAENSRKLLNKYDIDINDAANGVALGHPRPHNFTHTKRFNMLVNSRLHMVEDSMMQARYGKRAIRKALRRELRAIGNEVRRGLYE